MTRCGTCGDLYESRALRCPTCGAASRGERGGAARADPMRELEAELSALDADLAHTLAAPASDQTRSSEPSARLGRGRRRKGRFVCPRCDCRLVRYFDNAGRLVALGAVSFLTWGVGGIGYYLVRRNHVCCTSCGFTASYSDFMDEREERITPRRTSRRAPLPRARETGRRNARVPERVDLDVEPRRPLPANSPHVGHGRRLIGSGVAAMGGFVASMGVATLDGPPILGGSMLGIAGASLLFSGLAAKRREAERTRRGRIAEILRMAQRRRGLLTVTQTATELDVDLDEAEQLLESLDDDIRVRSVVSDDGVIYYDFVEIRHQPTLPANEHAKSAGGDGE